MSEPVKLRITCKLKVLSYKITIYTLWTMETSLTRAIQMIGETAAKIKKDFGFFPARVLRTFLKTKGSKNIPIQAIGLSLYEELPDTTVEQVGTEVIRTQWLDFSTLGEKSLVGKRVLIVDEVDDTRKTLGYAVSELQKDVQEQYKHLPADTPPTEFAIFVVHNKLKEKAAGIPSDVKYFPGAEIEDIWVDYPWEQQDIIEHTRLAEEDKKKQASASQQ
ncbi:hypothetical protein E3Q12_01622 [Wallemia mellicola]|nr:hypothetical protein E3Q12_01622 [Wallemia mellicola]